MNSDFNSQNDAFSSSSHTRMVATAPAEIQANFIRKTYVLFFAGILMAVAMGAVCLNVPAVANIAVSILRSPILALILILGGSFAAQAVSRVEGLNYVALFAFTGLIGLVFAPIVAMYNNSSPGIVGQAGFLSVVIFGAMTTYAFVSGKNFSFLGGILFVGMLGVVLAGVGNLFFFKNVDMSYWLAWASLLFSSGFVLYRTSMMIHEYNERDYCAAALGLFISFFNIFMSLLRILSGRR